MTIGCFNGEHHIVDKSVEVVFMSLKSDMAVSCQEKKVPRPSGFEG
jgi:hypothetical protein